MIQRKTRNTHGLTFSELGLLVYMLANADSHGNFQEHLDITADELLSSRKPRWRKKFRDDLAESSSEHVWALSLIPM
jgi:hypothetical protein